MIIAAAVRHNGVIHTLPPPKRHHDIVHMINARAGSILLALGEQGFIDENTNFIDRITAAKHAQDCGQLKKPLIAPPRLYSEDLW